MLKNRTWILIFAVAGLILSVFSLFLLRGRDTGQVVQIIQDGTVIREIDLSDIKEEIVFTIEASAGGSNTICVRPGGICIQDADCPDKICVSQGWLTAEQSAPIICLPHRLMIQFRSITGPDAVIQ